MCSLPFISQFALVSSAACLIFFAILNPTGSQEHRDSETTAVPPTAINTIPRLPR